jgi:hypothetical protein
MPILSKIGVRLLKFLYLIQPAVRREDLIPLVLKKKEVESISYPSEPEETRNEW